METCLPTNSKLDWEIDLVFNRIQPFRIKFQIHPRRLYNTMNILLKIIDVKDEILLLFWEGTNASKPFDKLPRSNSTNVNFDCDSFDKMSLVFEETTCCVLLERELCYLIKMPRIKVDWVINCGANDHERIESTINSCDLEYESTRNEKRDATSKNMWHEPWRNLRRALSLLVPNCGYQSRGRDITTSSTGSRGNVGMRAKRNTDRTHHRETILSRRHLTVIHKRILLKFIS